MKTELEQKDEQIEYLKTSFTEYREYAEEKMQCKGMETESNPFAKAPAEAHEKSSNDDDEEENQFRPQLSYQFGPQQLAPQTS
jgi:hypothetical protein